MCGNERTPTEDTMKKSEYQERLQAAVRTVLERVDLDTVKSCIFPCCGSEDTRERNWNIWLSIACGKVPRKVLCTDYDVSRARLYQVYCKINHKVLRAFDPESIMALKALLREERSERKTVGG